MPVLWLTWWLWIRPALRRAAMFAGGHMVEIGSKLLELGSDPPPADALERSKRYIMREYDRINRK